MSARNRLLLDVALFAAIVMAYAPAVTGISVHEWLSIAIIVPTLLHLIINWEWVVRIAKGALAKLTAGSWLNAIVDAALFVAAVTVSLSGLLISQVVAGTFGFTTSASAIWHTVHSISADVAVITLLAHFALHAKWMARVFQGWLDKFDAPASTNSALNEARR